MQDKVFSCSSKMSGLIFGVAKKSAGNIALIAQMAAFAAASEGDNPMKPLKNILPRR
jgi:hypothetical protein